MMDKSDDEWMSVHEIPTGSVSETLSQRESLPNVDIVFSGWWDVGRFRIPYTSPGGL